MKAIRVNGKITAPEVFIVEANGHELGVKTVAQALALARSQGLDLVEILPDALPPVCQIVDFGKFRYEMAKKQGREGGNRL